ncbi:MAG: hypothetical protein ACOC32_04970 [Nanoarchaeota archaeon]
MEKKKEQHKKERPPIREKAKQRKRTVVQHLSRNGFDFISSSGNRGRFGDKITLMFSVKEEKKEKTLCSVLTIPGIERVISSSGQDTPKNAADDATIIMGRTRIRVIFIEEEPRKKRDASLSKLIILMQEGILRR